MEDEIDELRRLSEAFQNQDIEPQSYTATTSDFEQILKPTKIHFSRAIYDGLPWTFLTFIIFCPSGTVSDRWEDDNQMMATPPVIPR